MILSCLKSKNFGVFNYFIKNKIIISECEFKKIKIYIDGEIASSDNKFYIGNLKSVLEDLINNGYFDK